MTASLLDKKARLAATTGHLQAVSPLNVISRGYSVLTVADGTTDREVATSVEQLTGGQAIRAWLMPVWCRAVASTALS